jgi:two-component system copper resistance phosphate regulon response regulator CusR
MAGSPYHPDGMHILVVEDEAKVARALKEGLEREAYEVTVARTGEEGYYLLGVQPFDLVVLDLMLPGRDGLEILATLRSRHRGIPVLILTARDAVQDRVAGLDAGADDYLVKPFAFPELLARLRALLRRGRAEQAARMKVADLEIDVPARRATRGGREVELTSREFELLEYLVWNRGRVVSREMLARDVWRETRRATTLDNVIDVHIARLRRKVDDSSEVKLIQTVRGVGFIIKEGDA